MNDHSFTFRYDDGFDLELSQPLAKQLGPSKPYWVHVTVRWTCEAGDDYDPGDYTTPPSGGPWVEELDANLLSVELYDDFGHIVERILYESASADCFQQQISEWCRMTPSELLDLLRRSIPELDDYHHASANRHY